MTVNVEKVKTIKTKGKRKAHPMARKYPGTPSLEFGTALTKFLDDLEPHEMKEFGEGTLCFEPEIVAEFYDSLQEGDVMGLGLFKGVPEFDTNHPAAYKLKVLKVHEGEDRLTVQNVSFDGVKGYEDTMGTIDVYFEDVSCAFGAGFADVLERDGKLFGVSEEIEYNIGIYAPVKEESKEESDSATTDSSPESEE